MELAVADANNAGEGGSMERKMEKRERQLDGRKIRLSITPELKGEGEGMRPPEWRKTGG